MTSIAPTPIDGGWLISSSNHYDSRGFLREWLPGQACLEISGSPFLTAQANFSVSKKGTLRGLHFSLAKEGQTKIVTCFSGKIFDVIVDLRKTSMTFGQWYGTILSPESAQTMYISPGIGHGFMALEENSVVSYLLSSTYAKHTEIGINPFDPTICIDWPDGNYILSEKDSRAPNLSDILSILEK